MPSKNMGQIHGLALQLLGKGMVELAVSDTTKIGTQGLGVKHLVVVLPNADDDGTVLPAYFIERSWIGLNTV